MLLNWIKKFGVTTKDLEMPILNIWDLNAVYMWV